MFYPKTKNTLTIFENVLFPNQKFIDNLWKCSIPKSLGQFNFKQTWHKTSWVKGIQDFEKQRINYTSNIMIFSQMFLLIEASS